MSETAKRLLLIGAAAFGLLVVVVMFALTTAGGMFGSGRMMNGPGGTMDGGFASAWGWMLLPLLFLLGLISLLVWAVIGVSSSVRPGRDPAEETLRNRFARGEVDADEYERALLTLRSDAPSSKNDKEALTEPEDRARGLV